MTNDHLLTAASEPRLKLVEPLYPIARFSSGYLSDCVITTPPNEVLLQIAEMNPPPPEWFEGDMESPF